MSPTRSCGHSHAQHSFPNLAAGAIGLSTRGKALRVRMTSEKQPSEIAKDEPKEVHHRVRASSSRSTLSLSLCAMLTPRSHPVFFESSECDLCFWYPEAAVSTRCCLKMLMLPFVFSVLPMKRQGVGWWSPAANLFEATINKICQETHLGGKPSGSAGFSPPPTSVQFLL